MLPKLKDKIHPDTDIQNREEIDLILKAIHNQAKLLDGNDLIILKRYLKKIISY